MNAFLKQVYDLAAARAADNRQRREEADSTKLKKWQAFRNNYETVALALKAVDGMICSPFKENIPEKRQGRTVRVHRLVDLPAEPPTDEQTYLIEVYVEWAAPAGQSASRNEFHDGWCVRWVPWADHLKAHTFDEEDAIYRSLHDDKLYSQKKLLEEVVKDLACWIDPSAYAAEAPQAARAIDL